MTWLQSRPVYSRPSYIHNLLTVMTWFQPDIPLHSAALAHAAAFWGLEKRTLQYISHGDGAFGLG